MRTLVITHRSKYKPFLDEAEQMIISDQTLKDRDPKELALNLIRLKTDKAFEWAVDRIGREEEVNVVVEPAYVNIEDDEVTYYIKYYLNTSSHQGLEDFINKHNFNEDEIYSRR